MRITGRSAAAALGAAAVLVACGHGTGSGADRVYRPPTPLPLGAPGQLISRAEVTGIPVHPSSRVWRFSYHSRSATGTDVAETAFALVPSVPSPSSGRPVYGWAHGTVGLGDSCAPSHDIRANLPPYGGQQLERGAVLVAPDGEGLGTPGTPPYGVGTADAHSLLDAVRASAALPGVGPLGPVLLAGQSEGAAAVLSAGQVVRSYAPELAVRGLVALAPGATTPASVTAGLASPYKGTVLMGAIGMTTAYPELDLSSFLTPRAMAEVPRVEQECVDQVIAQYRAVGEDALFRVDPSALPGVRAALERNAPRAVPASIPVLIAYGTADDEVPPAAVTELVRVLRAHGSRLTTKAYAAGHDQVVDAAGQDVLAWVAARW